MIEYGRDYLDAEEAVQRRPWQPVDLAAVLDGTYSPPQPTVGERRDGAGLFYRAKKHSVAAESEAGKSWLAVAVHATELRRGNTCVHIDFEDDEGGFVGRLLAAQVPPGLIRDRFGYIRPDQPITDVVNRSDLAQALGDLRPVFVCIDGVTEAMTMHGLNPLDNADAARFGRMLPGPIAAAGAAVAALDHVTKDRDGRGRYAIGAVHKLNGIDGAAYLLENRAPFGVGITGRSTLRIAKDRPAQLRRRGLPHASGLHWYGDLVLVSHHEDFAELDVTAPAATDPDFRPTHLMAKLAELIGKHGPISGRQLQAIAKGKAENNRQALAYLELDGHITATPHTIIKPYPDKNGEQE